MVPLVPDSVAETVGAVVSQEPLVQAAPTLMPWKAFQTACSWALPAP